MTGVSPISTRRADRSTSRPESLWQSRRRSGIIRSADAAGLLADGPCWRHDDGVGRDARDVALDDLDDARTAGRHAPLEDEARADVRKVVLMRRTVPVFERMTTVSVSAKSPRKCTPSSSEPSVTPVAEKMTSPEAMSCMRVFAVDVGDAHLAPRRSRSSSFMRLRGGPCICPPMQRSAAAASTPSGAPPSPCRCRCRSRPGRWSR